MSDQNPDTNGHELRVNVPEDVYEQLQVLAANQQMPAEEYAARMLTDDVTRARFVEGARDFIVEHAAEFADRFGPHTTKGNAA
ncbi:hypothetical protein [Streptomyces megasporus]|uniref:hypothetical protein n=1 Tax=Streptomyces megasporus TaxID=44060 RepID=UPI0004E15331|nr:hypothetical protein [Streptomyces megasporus]